MDSVFKEAWRYTARMHLALDIREACKAKRTGKGLWTDGFVEALLTRTVPLTLFTDAALPETWTDRIRARPDVRVRCLSQKGLWWHIAVAREVKRDASIDFYVSTVSYLVPFLIARKKNVIPIIHDLIAFRSEPHDRRATIIERLTLGRVVRMAHSICTISNTTRKDLLARYAFLPADRVTPIFAAPHGDAAPPSKRKEHSILCIGTLCPRKNQVRLMQAYQQLPQELRAAHPLILVGSRGWHDEEIVQCATQMAGVTWKKYVSDAEVASLYNDCICLAYPSLYEGFGLPLLEAMRRGIPILTSDRGSMREVAEDAAVLIEPENIDSLKNGLERLLRDATLRSILAAKGLHQSLEYSWDRTVKLFLDALKR